MTADARLVVSLNLVTFVYPDWARWLFPQRALFQELFVLRIHLAKGIGYLCCRGNPPFLTGCIRRVYATTFSFCAGVMPLMPMFRRSLL